MGAVEVTIDPKFADGVENGQDKDGNDAEGKRFQNLILLSENKFVYFH